MDAKFIATILCFVLGFFVVVIPLFIYLKDRKIAKEGLGLVVLGIILLGVPSFWSKVTIDLGEFKFILEQNIKELAVENVQLSEDVNRLNNEKSALITEVHGLKNQFALVEQSKTLRPQDVEKIRTSFARIDNKNKSMNESAMKLEQRLSSNKAKLVKVNNLVEKIRER